MKILAKLKLLKLESDTNLLFSYSKIGNDGKKKKDGKWYTKKVQKIL